MATRKVDEAKVVLSGDATKLKKAIQESMTKLKNLSKSVAGVAGKFALFGAAAVTAAGVGMTVLVKRSLEAIDNLGKLSARLGVATESLGRLQHVGNIAGLEFNTLTKAVQTAQRQVSEAAKGNKTYQKSLTELGLSATQLIAKSPEGMLFDLLEAMDKVENKTKRVGYAYDFFGARGTAMLQVLAGGVDGLRQTANEADRLGLVLDSKAVKAVEAANDSITRMKGLFTGVVQHITVALAPAIEKVSYLLKEKMLKAIEENGGSVEIWAKNVVLNVIKMVGEVTLVIEGFLLNALTAMGKIKARFGYDVSGIKEAQTEVHKIFETIINQLVLMGTEVRNGMPTTGFGEEGGTFGSSSDESGGKALNSLEEGALKAGASIRESFENLALDVRAPIKSIGESIENTFIGAANNIFSEIVGNLLSSLTERMFSSMGLSSLLGFAGGGAVNAGKPILVGERGPELFVPSAAGKIRNNMDSRGMAGGGGVVQHNSYKFDLVPSPTIKAMVEQGIAQAMPVIKADIFRSLQRGY